MKRAPFALALLVLSAAVASADVTVTTTIAVSSGQMNISGTQVSSAKGTKFRVDIEIQGQSMTILGDSATKQLWKIDHATKQIEPFDAQAAMANLPISVGDAKASATPNGQTKEILGRQCQGFDVQATMPMTIAGETITMKISGPAWIAKEGAGIAEFRAAQKGLSDLGFSSSPLAQGPQAKGMTELTRVMGEAGVVLQQEAQITMEGTGQMAAMMSQMGSSSMTSTVTAINTDSIPDAKFALPEGYTKK